MAIQRWEPYREAVSLRDAMNSLLQESFVRPLSMLAESDVAMLPLDIAETEDEFVVRASLPGVRPEDVQITAIGDTLTIRGEMRSEEERKDERFHLRERRYGQFQRTVKLSSPISADRAQATFQDGVLTLRLPKSEEAKPKQIRVAAGTSDGSEKASIGSERATAGSAGGAAGSERGTAGSERATAGSEKATAGSEKATR